MPNWIGDYVMALAVIINKINTVKQPFILIVPEKLVKLHQSLSDIPFIVYNRNNVRLYFKTVREIQKHFFTTLYLLPPSLSAAFLSFFCFVPRRRGINKDGRRFLLNVCLPESVRDHQQHIINEYAAILETPSFLPQSWEGQGVKTTHGTDDYIVFCPGANYGLAKQWTGYGKLATMMSNYKIIVLGSENDKKIGAQITREGGNHVCDLTGKTTFEEVVHCIANARCIVSNDSGLMHLAGFLAKPIIGIFGSTALEWTSPLGPKSIVISTHEPCSPCFKRECKYGHYHCMKNISPQMILKYIEETMSV